MDRQKGLGGGLKQFVKTGLVASKARSGRPKVNTLSEDQYIKHCSQRGRKATLSQIKKEISKGLTSSVLRA